MKFIRTKTLAALLIILFGTGEMSAQCGIDANYTWAVGLCDTALHNVSIQVTGSCSPYSILWENGSTGTTTQLDTGFHYVQIYDCNGCLTIDTFALTCTGWNGTTSIVNKGEDDHEYLKAPSPNPFSDKTLIEYHIPPSSSGTISLFDFKGALIRSFVLSEGEGPLEVSLSLLPNGIYYCVLDIDNGRITRSKKLHYIH